MVPDRGFSRSGNTGVFLTILDEGGLNQNPCSDSSLPVEHSSSGLSLGVFPAHGTMLSSIGLNVMCKYKEKVTHRFDKCLSQKEPSN